MYFPWPKIMPEQYFIIDFDSTFIQTEGLEELAEVVLKDNPKKEEILEEIKKITSIFNVGPVLNHCRVIKNKITGNSVSENYKR